jgi:Skp family chaperone for outer membrane proteins
VRVFSKTGSIMKTHRTIRRTGLLTRLAGRVGRPVLLLPSAIFLANVAFAASIASATDPAVPIALLNIDRIVKTYAPLLERLEPLKEEAKKLEEDVQLRQVELETVVNKLRMEKPGSPEFQKLQAQGAKLQQELQQFINTERANMQKKEAAILLGFYRELDQVIGKYAKEHGIKLVVRQQETSLDENQPVQEILKTLNRSILYEDGLDITDEILKALDARASAASKP